MISLEKKRAAEAQAYAGRNAQGVPPLSFPFPPIDNRKKVTTGSTARTPYSAPNKSSVDTRPGSLVGRKPRLPFSKISDGNKRPNTGPSANLRASQGPPGGNQPSTSQAGDGGEPGRLPRPHGPPHGPSGLNTNISQAHINNIREASAPREIPRVQQQPVLDHELAQILPPGSHLNRIPQLNTKRVIFLDCDGVLNTLRSLVAAMQSKSNRIVTGPASKRGIGWVQQQRGLPGILRYPGWVGPLERSLLLRLKKVLERTGALICLSTAWRHEELGRRALLHALGEVGIERGLVIGATPDLPGQYRAREILQWLAVNGPVASWVAIDDIDLWSQAPREMNGHTVRTYPADGFARARAKEAVDILLKAGEPFYYSGAEQLGRSQDSMENFGVHGNHVDATSFA
ncbi:hypothetical protein CYMTET_51477 [Cymbomonas tetramitiformis]|uniref:Uncharacterized protein n=1 Tax=Cymbomonas tetramitiformis TaxID=36881 RepID=A0AAE0BL37_9CHLO|nr:hypothetical protein CYMTET_51477 [Cymbomonas tetramitiformis]